MKKIKTKLSLQDIRIWGDEKLKTDVASTALHEAWVEIKLSEKISLKCGRQELSYDNERLITKTNWTQSSMSHDAIVLKFKNNTGWQFDFANAFNQESEKVFGNSYAATSSSPLYPNYKTLNILWINKKFNDNFSVTGIGIADGKQIPNKDNELYIRRTIGGNVEYKKSNVKAILYGYFQNGQLYDGQRVKAYYLNPEISYKVEQIKTNFKLGSEYSSGTKSINKLNSDNTNTFSILYGSAHPFMGTMDYFTDLQNDTKNGGLIDVYAKTEYQLKEQMSLKLDYHYFMLQNDVRDNNNNIIKKYLGSELDLSYNYDYSKDINLQVGYSVMFADKNMEILKGGSSKKYNHWAFLMLTIKPTIFSKETTTSK
jgi:hypothetical protein